VRISLVVALSALLLGILGSVRLGQAANEAELTSQVAPAWSIPLSGAGCPWSATDTNCHYSSPLIVDLNQNGQRDIVLATNNGHVMAISGNGGALWVTDVSPAFGRPAASLGIASSPAVADVDKDGRMEVVVGTGILNSSCHTGGVVVLEDNGQIKPGWPRASDDNNVPPSGCPDPIFSSPALGDLDNDGDMEIVVGGFDNRIYAWHHDGSLLNGFPVNSALFARVGWDNLRGRLADTVWGSPALADMDGDGFLDIVIGTDEGNLDGRYGGDSGGWTCPYQLPPGWAPGYCGGTLYVLDRFGKLLPGFPKYILENIQSTPALYDINLDNRPEIFIGTGNFYYNNSPDHPTYGFRLFAFDSQGHALPGWEGGKTLGGPAPASPAIGDIAGDNFPEIVISGMDKKLYAFHHDGRTVNGFPMAPRNQYGQEVTQDVGKTPILADFDGDGKMEIGLTVGWSPVLVNGDGRMLTNTNIANDKNTPYYATDGLLLNNLAVGDLDNDGSLEMVAQNSKLYVWDLPSGAKKAHWPMFKFNPARTSANIPPLMSVSPQQINLFAIHNQAAQFERQIAIRVPATIFSWQAETDKPQSIQFPNASGTANNLLTLPIQISIPGGLGPGIHTIGTVELAVHNNDVEIRNRQQSVVVQVNIWKELHSSFVPLMHGN
jgi:hypothetical protein